jgi:hypothetical protein
VWRAIATLDVVSGRMACLAVCFAVAFKPDVFIDIRRSGQQRVSTASRLDEYMRLPVEAYCAIPLPMRAELSRVDAKFFALRVPPLHFAVPGNPITMEPRVMARVEAKPNCVRISSDQCTLVGSPIVESLRLNECFAFRVLVLLTWDAGAAPCMSADSRIEVDVETPGLFRLLPRSLLQAIVSAATAVVLDSLLKAFLRNLAADHGRWSTDAAYRDARRRQLGA